MIPGRLMVHTLLGLGLTAMATSPLGATGIVQQFVGRAYSDSGQLLYEEHHSLRGQCIDGLWNPSIHEVSYRRPGPGEPFASKTLHYSQSLLRPEMTFNQPLWQEQWQIRFDDEDVRITLRAKSRQPEEFNLKPTPDMVFDAGFDHLVRQSWGQLRDGKPVEFQFLAPTRGRSYEFLLEPDQASEGNGGLKLVIRPNGLLTRLLVPPIELAYNQRGFLTRFSGLTNIRKNADTNFTADIRYDSVESPKCPLIP